MANYDNHREREIVRRVALGILALVLVGFSSSWIVDLWWVPKFGTEARATVTHIHPKGLDVEFTADGRTYTAFANEEEDEVPPTAVGDAITIRYWFPGEGIVWDTRLPWSPVSLFFAGFFDLAGIGLAIGVVMDCIGRTPWYDGMFG